MTPAEVDGSDKSCADYVPVDMREAGSDSGAGFDARKAAYRSRLHRVRRAALIAWSALLLVWAVGLALVVRGVDGDSIAGGTAYLVAILAPVALVVLMPMLYVSWRRKWRVDEFEDRPESAEEDPFEPDRFVAPSGRLANVTMVAILAVFLAALPWGLLYLDGSMSPIEVAIGVVSSLVLLGVLGWVTIRARHVGIVGTPDGVVITTILRRIAVPWDDVQEVRLDRIEVPSRYGTTTTWRIALVGRGDMPADTGWPFTTGTSRARARARHNITVAARWTQEHGLAPSASLEAGRRWAEGDISLDQLESSVLTMASGPSGRPAGSPS